MRSVHDTEKVPALADRIQRNGFEVTRAVWVYRDGEQYAVLGGTRMDAAGQAGLTNIPVLIHEGFAVEQIVRLSDEDNENDEYHTPVPLQEVWASYKRLSEQPADDYGKWTEDRIAEAKGVKQPEVNVRLKYAGFPQAVLTQFIKNDFLKESHAKEISQIIEFLYFK